MHTRWQVVRQQAGPDPWGGRQGGSAQLGVVHPIGKAMSWRVAEETMTATFSEAVFTWVTLTLIQCLRLLPSPHSAPLVNTAQKLRGGGQVGL